MHKRLPSQLLRLATLLVVVGNVAFNYLQTRLGPGPSVQAVSDSLATLFTPAGYAFAIWGLIYAAMLVFCVVSLLPSRRRDWVYDRLCPPLLAANLLSATWILVFTQGFVELSVAIILLNLAAALVFFQRAHWAERSGRTTLWATVPASLLAGWLCVATVANFSAALEAHDFHGGPLGPTAWTVLLLLVTGAASLWLAAARRDFIVPAVACWATVAIWSANRQVDVYVAVAALCVASVTGAIAAFLASRRFQGVYEVRPWREGRHSEAPQAFRNSDVPLPVMPPAAPSRGFGPLPPMPGPGPGAPPPPSQPSTAFLSKDAHPRRRV